MEISPGRGLNAKVVVLFTLTAPQNYSHFSIACWTNCPHSLHQGLIRRRQFTRLNRFFRLWLTLSAWTASGFLIPACFQFQRQASEVTADNRWQTVHRHWHVPHFINQRQNALNSNSAIVFFPQLRSSNVALYWEGLPATGIVSAVSGGV